MRIRSEYDFSKSRKNPYTKAKKAAEALAASETCFTKIASTLNQLKWMVGFNLAMSVGILLKLY